MKQQQVNKKSAKPGPQIIDNRQRAIPEIQIDPSVANLPLRAVFYVEVGDMETLRIQLLVKEINRQYTGARGGVHYVVPIRHGKIGTDIVFEQEFLDVVNKMCEVKDGQIVLKDGATEVNVVRETI